MAGRTAPAYARWLDAPEGYADADAIAVAWGRAIGSVYRLASLDRWRRIRHHGRTLYNLDDVDRTMTRIDAPSDAT